MMVRERTPYPPNWPDLAEAAKEAAGWRCAHCGVTHGSLAVSNRNTLYRVVLAACHLEHDPDSPAPRLAALCQRCHLRLDALQHWRTRHRLERERARAAGQLEWFAL